MDIQQLYTLIQKKSQPDKTDMSGLQKLVDEYPYLQIAIFLYLKTVYLYDNEQFDNELKRLSIKVVDRRALYYYIRDKDYGWLLQHDKKEEISGDKTDILLDAFFESEENTEELTALEYSISNSSLASTDYFSYIRSLIPMEKTEGGEEDNNVKLKHQNIIDTFLTKSDIEGGIGIRIRVEKNDSDADSVVMDNAFLFNDDDELNDDVFFTETLAKIYVRQKKYDKAYKIIKHLSLNNPKKNIYFADQLNFLEKLIINSKRKDIK